MKLRRKCFSPTWRMKNNHVKICDFSRGESVASVCNESINARGDDQLVWPSPLTLIGDVVSRSAGRLDQRVSGRPAR